MTRLIALLSLALLASSCNAEYWLAKEERAQCLQGNSIACNDFGARLVAGDHVLRDVPTGATFLDSACTDNVAGACTRLGVLYQGGREIEVDSARALDLLERGCAGQDPAGCGELGKRIINRDPLRATALLGAACDSTVTVGCVPLGRMLTAGGIVPRDDARAAQAFEIACNDRQMDGCVRLGDALEHGTGIPQDLERAQAIYRDGCNDRYDGESCYRLAQLYQRGAGVEASEGEAARLMRRACNFGYEAACPRGQR